MLECRFEVVVGLVPIGRTTVQDGDNLRLDLDQLPLEEVPEEVVIPVRLLPAVEWDKEEVRALDLLQLACRAGIGQYGVAHRSGHLRQDRRAPQEPQSAGPQSRQVLGPE